MSEEEEVIDEGSGLEESLDEAKGLSGLQKVLVGGSSVVLAGSAGARAMMGGESGGSSDPPAGATGFLAPSSTESAGEPGMLESMLPYLTEGSFFALMGFAVGYATRKIVRLLLILVAVFFVAVQLLSSQGIVDVDWQSALGAANDLILNLKENQTFSEMLKDKIPTTGSFFAGLAVGFKRG